MRLLVFRMEGIDFDQLIDYKKYKIYNDSFGKTRYKILITSLDKEDVSKLLTIYPKVITKETKESGSDKNY